MSFGLCLGIVWDSNNRSFFLCLREISYLQNCIIIFVKKKKAIFCMFLISVFVILFMTGTLHFERCLIICCVV